jgi:hypothetical protein
VLCELAGRAVEEERFVFCDGALAVVKRGYTFEEFLDSAFGAIRRDAIERRPAWFLMIFPNAAAA